MGQRACEFCTQNCFLFHGTKKNTPTSFFKVIVRDENLRILYFPPKFSCTVSDLVNKKITLNSSGQKWKVKISKVNGSLAFEEGWNVFSSDRGLKVGYFVLFNYIKDSHFDVKIYDTSACERLDSLKKENQKKRSKCKSGSTTKDDTLVTQSPKVLNATKPDVPRKKCQSRSGSPIRNATLFTQGSNAVSKQGVLKKKRQRSDVDLVERDDLKCGVIDMTKKIANGGSKFSNVDCVSHLNDAKSCNEDSGSEGILGTGTASDAPKHEISGRSNSLGEMKTVVNGMTPEPSFSFYKLHTTGEMPLEAKKENVTLNESGATGLPEDINQDNFEKAFPLSCVVPNNNNGYLTLPKCLPLKNRRAKKLGRMVVLLRDSLRRLWTVFYHEQPSLQLLTHGWLDFCRANNIQPNDVCVFEVESESKSQYIFAVSVVHSK